MVRLQWGTIGERFFEAGIDRGVLYIENEDGVAWNGLVSVSESLTGGDISKYFIDGFQYAQQASTEHFEATIEAYTYPDEFNACEGTLSATNGLQMTHQKKKTFGLSYRTRVGNDIDGIEHAYKLHLIYNALASPSGHVHNSVGESISPDNFSWKITTKPFDFVGFRPTPHVIIDTREAPKGLILEIEDILYGTDDAAPRLPDPAELIFLFSTFGSSVFDAGTPDEPYYITFDGGSPPSELQTSTIDGGTP